jgi:hypothetical protein
MEPAKEKDMKRSTQQKLAKKSAKAKDVTHLLGLSKVRVETDRKGEVTKVEKTPMREVVEEDRKAVLKALRDAGLKVESKKAWHKAEGKERRRVYVSVHGPQVHLSGFTVRGHNVEQVSEAEAKRRHLGSVRGILFLDRNRTKDIKAAMRDVVAELR